MKIENLHVGLVAKNYKHMCEILEEEAKGGGKHRQLHLKRWSYYFTYKKEGNRLIVTGILTPPKELPKGGNFTPYIEQISTLLIQILLRSNDKRVNLPKSRLFEMLNMINGNYGYCKKNIDGLSKFLNVNKIDVHDFYNSTDDVLTRNIESSLKDLKNKKAIFHQTVLMVVKNNIAHEATDKDFDIIYPIQVRVLNEMDFESMVDVYKNGVLEEYTKRTNELLFKEAGINYVYEAYDIYLNRDVLLKELDKTEFRSLKSELNDSVKDRLLSNAEKRAEKQHRLTDQWFEELNYDKKSFRAHVDYIPNQLKITNALIDEDYVDFVAEIKGSKKTSPKNPK